MVIAIIGILIALLLPAVQAAREAARRSQCTSNLSQLGIALHLYQGVYEVFPPGVVNPKGPIRSEPIGYHMSWLAQILPYIEEQVLFDHIDFSQGAYAKKNAPAAAIGVRLFTCPSDGGARYGSWSSSPSAAVPSEDLGPRGMSSYAGCHHDVEAPIAADNHGVFFLNSRIRPRDVKDGLSHTLFVGEKGIEPNDLGWMSGTRATLRNTGALPSLGSAGRFGGMPMPAAFPGPGAAEPRSKARPMRRNSCSPWAVSVRSIPAVSTFSSATGRFASSRKPLARNSSGNWATAPTAN